MNYTQLKDSFAAQFGGKAMLYWAPGRINIIGEHTDYNGGFVLPGAVDKGIRVAIALNGTDRVRLMAADLNQSIEFGLQESDLPDEQWARYVFGVCREMAKRGAQVKGFDATFSGDVPLGAGMSSSAALESAFAFAINDMLSLNFNMLTLAQIGQATERNYVGLMCGIMDQFASCNGRKGNLMKLDCKDGSFEYIPFDPEAHGYKVVLVDSCVKHTLADSPYNKRRESCQRVLEAIQQRHGEVETLRDATLEWLEEVVGSISQIDYIRALYAIQEVARVLQACQALQKGDYEALGAKMYATHIGLSVLYQVSCDETDFLTEVARECSVSGSRIMGGGFGGCTINIVKQDLYDNFTKIVANRYKERFGVDCKIYPVVIGHGACRIEQ